MDHTSRCTSVSSDPLNESSGKLTPAASGRERRRDPRYPLSAEVRVIDIGSRAEFKLRISDLSISGCYLDFPNPLRNGTDRVLANDSGK